MSIWCDRIIFLSDDGGVEKCASDLLKTVHSSILSLQLLPAAHPEFEMKNTAFWLVSPFSLPCRSPSKGKRLHWCRSPGISIFPSSFSLDSPYLVGEMHCTVKKKRHSIVEKQSGVAGYSSSLAVFVVDGIKKKKKKNQLVCPAVYWTSFKRNNPPIVTFPLVPWPGRKKKSRFPATLLLFLTLNCPQTLFYFPNRAPLYRGILTEAASPLRAPRVKHWLAGRRGRRRRKRYPRSQNSFPKKVEVLTFQVNCFESLSSCSSP